MVVDPMQLPVRKIFILDSEVFVEDTRSEDKAVALLRHLELFGWVFVRRSSHRSLNL